MAELAARGWHSRHGTVQHHTHHSPSTRSAPPLASAVHTVRLESGQQEPPCVAAPTRWSKRWRCRRCRACPQRASHQSRGGYARGRRPAALGAAPQARLQRRRGPGVACTPLRSMEAVVGRSQRSRCQVGKPARLGSMLGRRRRRRHHQGHHHCTHHSVSLHTRCCTGTRRPAARRASRAVAVATPATIAAVAVGTCTGTTQPWQSRRW